MSATRESVVGKANAAVELLPNDDSREAWEAFYVALVDLDNEWIACHSTYDETSPEKLARRAAELARRNPGAEAWMETAQRLVGLAAEGVLSREQFGDDIDRVFAAVRQQPAYFQETWGLWAREVEMGESEEESAIRDYPGVIPGEGDTIEAKAANAMAEWRTKEWADAGTFFSNLSAEVQKALLDDPYIASWNEARKHPAAALTELSERNLKNAQRPGDQLNFMYRSGWPLAIGEGHIEYFAQNWTGTITVTSRGSLTSTGVIDVRGLDSGEQDAFKSALRQFSNKKITFA
jgi:hypothetical protein